MEGLIKKDLIVEGKLIAKAGAQMTAEDAYQLCQIYNCKIDFFCPECNVLLKNINIIKKKIRAPHFKNHKKTCKYYLKNITKNVDGPKRKVKSKEIYYSKLISPSQLNVTSTSSNSQSQDDYLIPDNNKNYREEKTTKEMKDICIQYLQLTKDQKFEDYHEILKGKKLILPHSKRNYGYQYGIWNANTTKEDCGNRIYQGILGQWVSCLDGELIFYKLPKSFKEYWKPLIIKIPNEILSDYKKNYDNWKKHAYLKKHAKIFVYGYPDIEIENAFVITLEHISYLYLSDFNLNELPPSLSMNEKCDSFIKMRVPKIHEKYKKLQENISLIEKNSAIEIKKQDNQKNEQIIQEEIVLRHTEDEKMKKISGSPPLKTSPVHATEKIRVSHTNTPKLKKSSGKRPSFFQKIGGTILSSLKGFFK